MEILTKFTPSFRLALFFFALPFFGYAQQFPVNNQKIVQGVGTTAQGISSYSSSPPTTNPTASTFRHVTSLHMDTVLQVQYIYKRPRWYPISTVRRATPPPATASSGSTTIDYTESLWQNTADSLTYYYEEENACWQPIGTYISSTTPSDVAATGSTGAICYGYGLWYDPDIDSIYAQQGATWTAIGAGGGSFTDWTAAADSGTPAVIGDGETVTIAGGYGVNTAISGNTVTVEVDTAQVSTPYDLSLKTWLKPEIESGNYVQIDGGQDAAAGLAIEDVGDIFLYANSNTGARPTDNSYIQVFDATGAAGMQNYVNNSTLGTGEVYLGYELNGYDGTGDTAVVNIRYGQVSGSSALQHRIAFYKDKDMRISSKHIQLGKVSGASDKGKVTISSDTVIVSGLYPVGGAGDSVLVRDATTKRIELRAQSDISGGGGGISGLTTNRIPYASSSTSIADGFLLQSAAGLTLDANLAFRQTGGTTASRPTGAAGMQYWNTSNGWLDIHNGTSWFNPLRSATATGLGTAGRVFYANSNGVAAADDLFYWDATNDRIGLGLASSPTYDFESVTNADALKGLNVQNNSNSANARVFFGATASSAIGFVQALSPSYSASTWGGSYVANAVMLGRYEQAGNNGKLIITNSSGSASGTRTIQFHFGTTSVQSDANMTARFTPTTFEFNPPGGDMDFTIQSDTDANNFFSDGGTNRVGIGNNAPQRKLHVTGEARITDLTTDTPTLIIGADADGDLGAITVSTGLSLSAGSLTATGTTETASNGLTKTVNDIALGGSLTGNTTITGGAFGLTVSTTGSGVSGLTATSSTLYGVKSTSTAGTAAYYGETENATTNTLLLSQYLARSTTGTAANGIGQQMTFATETTIGTPFEANSIKSLWTDATHATRTSQLIFTGVNSGSVADLLTLEGNGKLKANTYGVGTHTGTAARNLQVTSAGAVIEKALPAYGEASIFGSQTLAFTSGSTTYDTLSGYTLGEASGFSLVGGALKYTGTETIKVQVTVSMSLTFAEAGQVFGGIRQNTTNVTKSRAQQKIDTAADVNNLSMTCILTLATNDLIRIELAPSAHTGDDNITVSNCNFNITEI